MSRLRLMITSTLLAACSAGPADPDVRAAASVMPGVEQILDVSTVVDAGTVHFEIASVLHNARDEAVTLRVRSCYLRESDLRGERAGLRLRQPLMLCASDGHDITLASGATSEVLAIQGEMPAGSSHRLEVRHALKPESWAPLTLEHR